MCHVMVSKSLLEGGEYTPKMKKHDSALSNQNGQHLMESNSISWPHMVVV